MNDEKKDENPIDMSEVGPYCILLIDVNKNMNSRIIRIYVYILVLEVYKSFIDQFPKCFSEKPFPFFSIKF